MKINDYVVTEDISIKEVMSCIEKNARGVAFICDHTRLVGVVTDGDIRRYILSDGELNESVKKIVNRKPFCLPVGEKQKAKEFMKEKCISAVPIVDEQDNLQDILFLMSKKEEVYAEIAAPLVIMAGGKGTRLKPYTDILPKPLIPIGEQTIAEHIMERFERYHCHPLYMIINYKKNFIKSYFLDAKQQRNIQFIEEPEFLGTGGGLKLLSGIIQEDFFLTNCDILVEGNYAKMMEYHKQSKSIITLVCAKKEMIIPYGTIEIGKTGYAESILEKPQYQFLTNTGLYVISPEFLNKIPDNTFTQITDIIQQCIDEKEKVGVYTVEEEFWMDMGQMEELQKMREYLG